MQLMPVRITTVAAVNTPRATIYLHSTGARPGYVSATKAITVMALHALVRLDYFYFLISC